ncbi:putative methyltransferase family protein [Candida parapsilosis]|uniref:FAM86 N-terminal domain-containing protein n=2 Tax=Candida parapsilosis TaxID=5480 RepID=G8BEN5_CANPC|nr:uncharacterized protein CPAR2_213160 [Candida parapsilosis]KAF6054178.1 putative methyltransferase family protein [Candida parapsilosis]KAF6056798.1 putative methyltransferase family protein [Candida parapsilosis]KAF6059733.1 putative methyltransferase family protein [Candida parapsilosis]KAF6068486.1 putative methyltransferase family protein [Candida parapsilosis]KAI5902022.1 Protein-lysine N-methyltransferase EFM3 [Candida parapsilosis]
MNKLRILIEQRVPIKNIHIPNELTSYASQLELVDFVKPQIENNPFYFRKLLSKYINEIEELNEETSDELYELYVDEKILNAKELPPDVPDMIKYHISGFNTDSFGDDDVVVMKEMPKLISGNNTTGLRTWEAALYLSNILNVHEACSKILPFDLTDKTVVELGCGTGLLGLSLAKHHHKRLSPLKRVIMTDGSGTVFDNINETLRSNSLQDLKVLQFQQLIWGEPLTIEGSVEVIVAADITYDSRILEPLCRTIDDFFNLKSLQCAVIAATVRNIDTINLWEKELEKWFPKRWGIAIREGSLGKIEANCYFDANTPEIRVYTIK